MECSAGWRSSRYRPPVSFVQTIVLALKLRFVISCLSFSFDMFLSFSQLYASFVFFRYRPPGCRGVSSGRRVNREGSGLGGVDDVYSCYVSLLFYVFPTYYSIRGTTLYLTMYIHARVILSFQQPTLQQLANGRCDSYFHVV